MGILAASIGIGLAVLAGCGGGARQTGDGAAMGAVTGSVAYRERIALPPNAVIRVQLVDVSRQDAPATVLGEQVITADGTQPPFSFSIAYDPATIDPRFSYAVQARIEVDGQLRFINDQRFAVLTHGAPSHVDMMLKRVGGG